MSRELLRILASLPRRVSLFYTALSLSFFRSSVLIRIPILENVFNILITYDIVADVYFLVYFYLNNPKMSSSRVFVMIPRRYAFLCVCDV